MTELLATFELFDDGSITVHMRDRRYDVDTLAGIASAAVAALDVSWAAAEEHEPSDQPGLAESRATLGADLQPASDGAVAPLPAPVSQAEEGGLSRPEGTPAPPSPGRRGKAGSAATQRAKGPYPCPDCDRVFPMPGGLGLHRKAAHRQAEVAQPAERLADQPADGGSTPPLRSTTEPWRPTPIVPGTIPPPVNIHAREEWMCRPGCSFRGKSREELRAHLKLTGHDEPAPVPVLREHDTTKRRPPENPWKPKPVDNAGGGLRSE